MPAIVPFDQVKINIAQGKFVVVTAVTQSGSAQSVKITNPNGLAVFLGDAIASLFFYLAGAVF
ncbi:MAG: hypothetical protein HC890_03830 [Chloroflexaceae bacterium]|nr:hypothetical protein [Chloroflexaceae bacterium]